MPILSPIRLPCKKNLVAFPQEIKEKRKERTDTGQTCSSWYPNQNELQQKIKTIYEDEKTHAEKHRLGNEHCRIRREI